jgi:hypothetical protein
MILGTYTAAEVLLFISAGTNAITAILVVMQRKTIAQVEKQGNSRELESKRLVAMFARRLANTGTEADKAIAADAEKVYAAALVAVAENIK